MSNYFYLIVLIVILVHSIIRNIYLFKKGQYNPYIFRKSERELPFIVNFAISIGITFCIFNIKPIAIMIYTFLIYSFCLVVCLTVLNYLSYMKTKDKKIIFHTVIFNIIVVIVSIFLWQRVMR